MTLPFERTRAVKQVEQFLLDLIDSKKTPKVPKNIRDRALSLLRHYPTCYEIDIISEIKNEIFGHKEKK